MPKQTYAENPIHPVLNDYPAALVPASVAFDMLHLVTRRRSFKVASFFSLLFALITGGAAAATGYQDYREIPGGTDTKRLANAHGMLNAGVMGAVALQLLLRSTGRVGIFVRLLNVASAAGIATSSWYGMHLVYRDGLRVRGVDPLAASPDAGTDTGKPLADRLETLVAKVPDTDLSTYVDQAMTGVEQARQAAAQAASQAADAVTQAVGRGGSETGLDTAPDELEFDDQGALSGAIPEGEPVDVAASVRESLGDEPGR
ncbi:MAG TPA: DUF2231 domain-containing protein [Candidatus Limnocylindrales bacterium]|nr:DUF2231 domain-containing protein [Candidatus Limnocylindrales bacterium]